LFDVTTCKTYRTKVVLYITTKTLQFAKTAKKLVMTKIRLKAKVYSIIAKP